MSTITFDTHKFVKQLESAGVPPAQAEVIIDVFRAAQESAELATKNDLKQAVSELRRETQEVKFDLLKWIVGLSLAQMALLIGILLKLPH
jgi:hypothetical protein